MSISTEIIRLRESLPQGVRLLAVSKFHPVEALQQAYDAGQRAFGESRPQELKAKYEVLPRDIEWVMIGHLQTNKVKDIIERVEMIESVDSLKLAKEISRQAEKRGITMDILIEVNIGGEESKWGFTPEETATAIEDISKLPNIRIKGLMSIPPVCANPEENRKYFRKMYKLFIDIRTKKVDNSSMDILSMGMSDDYEIAIEEGANLIRLGTALFGKRNYKI